MIASFARNSTAHLQNGTLVNTNLPRFETGRFGQAVMVEEGTTNLISPPRPPRFSSASAPPTIQWDIANNFRISGTDYTTGMLAFVVQPTNLASADITAFTLRIENPVNTPRWVIQLIDVNGAAITTGWSSAMWMFNAFYNGWFRTNLAGVVQLTFSGLPAGVRGIGFGVRSSVSDGGQVCSVDRLQIEARSYATSFINGTRAAESLTIPTAGILSPAEGTIEFWTRPNHASTTIAADGVGFHHLAWISGTTGFALRRVLGAIVFVSIRTAGDLLITHNMTWTAGQDIYLAVRWTATDVSLFVNGVLRGTVAKFDNPSSIPLEFGWRTGHTPSNALHDDLRISNRARTDQEIADAFASGQPLQLDASTTALHNFNNLITSQVFHHAGNTPAMVVPRAVVNPGLVYVGRTVVETVAASELRQAQNITGLTTISVIAKSLFRRTINIKSPTHAVIKDSRTRVVLK